jgi:hypothetical protein
MPGISAVSPPISAQPASRSPGDAADDCRALFRVELSGGEVIEKEQRLRALDHQVVDAHGDEIDADGIVDAGFDRHLELGPHAVIGGDQHRIGKARRLEIEQPAKPPISPSAPGLRVARTSGLMRLTISLPASMSTPASA